jgi:type IV pilus assembly protein PilM
MAKSVIGLDIGSFSIKLVELEYDNNRYKLKNYNIRDLFTESETYDSEGPGAARLETAVREVFSSLKISPKKQRNINTAFGGPSVAVKQVRSIPLASDEMESALIFEARKHLPLDESDAIFDGRIQMFKNIGITPNVIDAEILALINSYFVAQGSLLGEEALVFLNIGAKYSTIGIIGEKTLLFNRDISWAGDNFTEDIKNIMKVEYPEAETVKKERGIGALLGGGESNAGGIRVARRMALDNLTDEIRRSLRYYTKETGCREFSKILLSGGSSLLSNLNSHLAQQLNMTVEIYNPFSSFITPPGFDDNLGSRLAVACGLALREE